MHEKLPAAKASLTAFFTAVGVALGWKGIMVLAWAALMALDYITGTMAAMKEGQWSSKKAREGAWHKCGAMIVVMVSGITDGILLLVCGNMPMLNIQWPEMILPLILVWYILTELGSILENAIRLGANPPGWLAGMLEAGRRITEEAGSSASDSLK